MDDPWQTSARSLEGDRPVVQFRKSNAATLELLLGSPLWTRIEGSLLGPWRVLSQPSALGFARLDLTESEEVPSEGFLRSVDAARIEQALVAGDLETAWSLLEEAVPYRDLDDSSGFPMPEDDEDEYAEPLDTRPVDA